MFDASQLGKAILSNRDDMSAAIRIYEEDMFSRSAAEAADSDEILDLCLGKNAPYSLIAFFQQAYLG